MSKKSQTGQSHNPAFPNNKSGNNKTVNKKSDNNRSNNLRMYLSIICVVIIVYSIFARNVADSSSGIRITPRGIRLFGPEEMEDMFVSFDDLISAETITSIDYGEKINGVDTSDYCYGTWRNEEYGEYGLCIRPKIHTYVLAQTSDGTYVFNAEGETTTEQIPQAIKDYLEKKAAEGDAK